MLLFSRYHLHSLQFHCSCCHANVFLLRGRLQLNAYLHTHSATEVTRFCLVLQTSKGDAEKQKLLLAARQLARSKLETLRTVEQQRQAEVRMWTCLILVVTSVHDHMYRSTRQSYQHQPTAPSAPKQLPLTTPHNGSSCTLLATSSWRVLHSDSYRKQLLLRDEHGSMPFQSGFDRGACLTGASKIGITGTHLTLDASQAAGAANYW